MKKQIFTILLLLFTSSLLLFSKKKEDGMQNKEHMEQREKTTELNYFKNPRYHNKPYFFEAEDSIYIVNSECHVNEYSMTREFCRVQKIYYQNGQLKEKCIHTLFSKTCAEEYNEEGYLIKRTLYKSPVKDKLIDGMDYVTFFEEEGWYNRATGESVFSRSRLNKGELSSEIFRHFIVGVGEDSLKMSVYIWGVETNVPEKVLDKYGKVGENGIKYLGELQDGTPEVTYLFDIPTGKYEVSCVYVLEED